MNRTVKVETEHYSFTLVPQDYSSRRGPRAVRVYSPSVTPDLPTPPYGSKGENVENDKAWRAYNREELRLMQVELSEALSEATDAAEKADEGVWAPVLKALSGKLRFSRKAGCSCPCSPGFIAESMVSLSGVGFLTQINIDRKAPAPERTFTFADFDLFAN